MDRDPAPTLKDTLRSVRDVLRTPDRWVRSNIQAKRIATEHDAIYRKIMAGPRDRRGLINLGLDGYLWPEEARELYERASTAPGDVLELGTYRGLSAYVLSTALDKRGHGKLVTCDISAKSSRFARRALRNHPGFPLIEFVVDDATAFLDRLIDRGVTFGFAFIDHDHRYEPTREVAIRLPKLIVQGGSVMFHDYADPSAANPRHPDKVMAAVKDTIERDAAFAMRGVVGSSAVFQKN